MAREIPRDELLRLLRGSGRSIREAARLSRRDFMAAVTAASAATHSLVVSAAQQDPPEFHWAGRILQVRFRGHQWDIDPARFGERAKVEVRKDGADFHILLSHANYPGTNLAGNVRVKLRNDGARWRIELDQETKSHDPLAHEVEPPLLEDWMRGKASFEFRRKSPIRVGEVTISPTEGHLACTVDASLRLRWRGPASINLHISRFKTSAGTLDAWTGTHEVLQRTLGDARRRSFTTLAFEDTALGAAGISLARVAGVHRLDWSAREPRLGMIAFDSTRARNGEALLTIEAFGALELHGPGFTERGAKLLLDKAVLVTWASSPSSQVQIAYTLRRAENSEKALFETDGFSLEVTGSADPVTLDIKKAALARFEVRVTLHAAHVPVRGASMASVAFAGLPMAISLPDRSSRRDCHAVACFGSGSLLDLPLETGTLHLRRSADLFDLRFEFRNFRLECASGKTTLFERWAHGGGCEAKPNPPTLIAIFWPQHVQEEVFAKKQDMSPELRSIDTLKFPDDLARTAIAAPSRVALQGVEPRENWQKGVELTIEQITDWEDLTLAVHARALPADATLEQQLRAIQLDPQATRTDARHAIFTSLTSQPSADQTSLEPVTGLVVSPDASAKFVTPRTRPSAASAIPLWSARLRLDKNSAVRALHARQVNFGFLSGACTPDGRQPELHEFVATLSAQDRAELVVLMSAYAMPSLRRLLRDEGELFDDPKGMIVRPSEPLAFLSNATEDYPIPNGDGTNTTLKVAQEGILVPRGYQEFDLTMSALKGTLRSRWEGEPPAPLATDRFFGSALNIEGYIHRTVRGRDALVQVAYKGFLFPLGHRAALIKVSERPFSPARGNADMLDPTAYLIQRQYIVTRKPVKTFPALGQPFQGREFPATRVQMMTVVTPEIVDVLNAKDERLNLGAWLLPPGRKPNCDAPGRAPETSIGRVFWPRTRRGKTANDGTSNVYGNEVQFEYRLDGVQQPLRSPLVFVDNTAAHHAITMQALVRYYEELPFSRDMMDGKAVIPAAPVSGEVAKKLLRLAVTGSVERRYAPALKSGETSFQTEYWALGATGGIGTQNGAPRAPIPPIKSWQGEKSEDPAKLESFSMDALMEGADQPPFYPRVHRGYIKMQSLERLLGRPQGLIEVGFARRYIVHAMEAAANPSTIYLDVLEPAVDLDVSGQGDASGGVAKPNARLAAISRSLGMVGGRPLKPGSQAKSSAMQVRRAPVAASAGVTSPSIGFDTSAAQAGNFDPAEFLGGALADALLLGVIPLKDVIRVVAIGLAPKLREVAEYASEELAEALPGIAGAITSAIGSAIEAGNKAANSVLGSTTGAAIADPLQEFYPALARRTTRLQQVCARIATLPPGEFKQQFGALAGELVEAGKDFAQAVEEVARNPIPKGLAEYVQKLRDAAAALQKLSDPAELRKFVVEQVRRFATQLFENLAEHLVGKSDELGALDIAFGVDPNLGQVAAQRVRVLHEIVNNPQAAVDRLRSSVMQNSLPGLFVQAFSRLEAVRQEVEGFLAFARSEVTDEVIGLMAQGDAYLKQMPALRKVATEFTDAAARALHGFDAADALRRGGLSSVFEQAKAKVQPEIVKLANAYATTASSEAQKAAKAEADRFREMVTAKLEEIAATAQPKRDALERDLRELEGMLAGWQRAAGLLSSNVDAKVRDIEAKVRRAIDAELDRQTKVLEDKARAAVEDVLGKVATDVVAAAAATFDAGEHLIELVSRSANGALQAWCTGSGAAAMAELQALLVGSKTYIDETLSAARKLHADLMQLDVPETVPSEVRAEAQSQLALARRLVQQSIDQAELLLKRLPELPANPCADAKGTSRLVRLLDELCRARLRLLDNIVSGLAAAARCQVLLEEKQVRARSVFKAARTDLCSRIKEMLDTARTLVVPPSSVVAALRARVGEIEQLLPPHKKGVLAALIEQLEDKTASVDRELGTLSQQCQNAAEALDALARGLEGQRALLVSLIEGEERRLASFVLDIVLSKFVDPQKAMEALGNSMVAVSGFVGGIGKVHADLEKALVTLLAAIRGAAGDSALGELLATIARPGLAALEQARDAVGGDASLLTAVQKALAARDAPAALATIRAVQTSWNNAGPGLARAADLLARVLQSLMRGQLASFFDFNSVRDEILRRLLELLPTRIRQTYDFDARLEDFPSGDPVFQINRGASPDQLPLAKAKNDLVLETSVEVDLVKNTRRATLKGTIRPFDIRLLGSRLDLATVKFKGAIFEARTDTRPTYEADLLGVEIGSMLEFIKALQSYFAPQPGNGPYVGITLFPPEAVAGYRYAAPMIPVGTLFFLNIAIDVSMHLPFDNRQAYFRFAFASRELPFLISAPPYGGGGFLALLANAKGIIGFEIQFEFGAVVPIKFGPLSAQGRVTAGIYLMSAVGTRVLEGFVCAVGEGNIACFGVSVSIVVRVRQQEGGAMQGSSTYRMSFKVGIARVGYSFTAQYRIKGGSSERSARSIQTLSKAKAHKDRDQWITTRVPPKQSKWKDYRKHVALEGAKG